MCACGKRNKCVPSGLPYLDLLWGPLVQVDGLDAGYVHAQVPVDAGAPDADEHTEVPGSPSRSWWREKRERGREGEGHQERERERI